MPAIYLHRKVFSVSDFEGRILILSPSIRQLEVTLRNCERELEALDMAINFKKSSYMRVGPRHDVLCAPICSSSETTLPWAK